MKLWIVTLAVGLLVGAGVGVSVGASTVPQLHACAQTNGLMRYVATAKCKTGEKLLIWGTTGPKGATGAPGAAGGAGAIGYYLLAADGNQPLSQSLPAGGYLVDLTSVVSEPATCSLSAGGGSRFSTTEKFVDVRIPVLLTSDGKLSFLCFANSVTVSASTQITIWVANRLGT